MLEPSHVMRDAILDLLTNEEVAAVQREANARLMRAGEEYIDLEHVELGVRQASGLSIPRGYVLPRTAVSDMTWHRIVRTLIPRPTLRGIKPAR